MIDPFYYLFYLLLEYISYDILKHLYAQIQICGIVLNLIFIHEIHLINDIYIN